MNRMGRNDSHTTGFQDLAFAINRQLELPVDHMANLFMGMRVLRQHSMRFNLPVGERHGFRMNKLHLEPGNQVSGLNIIKSEKWHPPPIPNKHPGVTCEPNSASSTSTFTPHEPAKDKTLFPSSHQQFRATGMASSLEASQKHHRAI